MTRHGYIEVARVYEQRSASQGHRVLIDWVWSRGLTKAAADIDEWCKDVAPSPPLRRWYGHDAARFAQFRERYLAELDDGAHAAAVARLRALGRHNRLILLTATKDLNLSHARVLAERLSWGQAIDEPTIVRVHLNQR